MHYGTVCGGNLTKWTYCPANFPSFYLSVCACFVGREIFLGWVLTEVMKSISGLHHFGMSMGGSQNQTFLLREKKAHWISKRHFREKISLDLFLLTSNILLAGSVRLWTKEDLAIWATRFSSKGQRQLGRPGRYPLQWDQSCWDCKSSLSREIRCTTKFYLMKVIVVCIC